MIESQRLIEQRVPFIAPGNQLYLPDLGIDLREHFRRLRQRRESLSPAAQVAMLAYLLGLAPARITPQELAVQRGYSAMTMTRVADELDQAGLIESERVGRNRGLTFPADRKAAWGQALSLLESPVQSRVWVSRAQELCNCLGLGWRRWQLSPTSPNLLCRAWPWGRQPGAT